MAMEQLLTQPNGRVRSREEPSSTIQKRMQVLVNLVLMHLQLPLHGGWMIGSTVLGQHLGQRIQYGQSTLIQNPL